MRKEIIAIIIVIFAIVFVSIAFLYLSYTPDKGVLEKGVQNSLETYEINDVAKVDSKWENNTHKVVLHVEGLYETLKPAIENRDEEYIMQKFYNKADAMLYIPESTKEIIGIKGFYKNSKATLYDDKAQKKMLVIKDGEITYDCVSELRLEVRQ